MGSEIFFYPLTILETDLDVFGHVNNAKYLILFEQARWDLLTKKGYGLKEIMARKKGPVILEINIRFLKEVHSRDEVVIETVMFPHTKKTGKMVQTMKRGEEICSIMEVTVGLFDLKERKLIFPTEEWKQAFGDFIE